MIVPSLNQVAFLARTLESIFAQRGGFDRECLVFDGGSTDGSVDVIREFAARAEQTGIAFRWVSEKDEGQAAAINKGLRVATGDVLGYLNSDDCYAPDALQEVVRAFCANPRTPWVTGRCIVIDSADREIQRAVTVYRNFWLNRYSYSALLKLNFVAQPSTFWTRDSLMRAGLFDESLHYAMDYDYWLRLGRLGDPVVVPRPLSYFRIHSKSKGGRSYRGQFGEDEQVMRRYTGSRGVRLFHRLHNALVVLAYRFIK